MWRLGLTPHVAQNTARSGGSAIDGRTKRHEGYVKSINARRGIEKVSAVFGLHVIGLKPVPAAQPAQLCNRGRMNVRLPRGVASGSD